MTQKQLKYILTELCSLPGENEIVEFKEAKTGFDFNKLGKYFSALSNEANLSHKSFGWLVFGIENEHKSIVGSNFRPNRVDLDNLKGEVGSKTTNRITFIEIYELPMANGLVVMFQIPAAPKGIPIAWEGHYYGRDGEELSPLNLEEIERIRSQTAFVDWSAQICPEATIENLDKEAILLARTNFKIKNPRLSNEIDEWDNITFLNKARVCISGKITNAAIILLGTAESESLISPQVARITWILKDKDGVERDYQHFYCPFLIAVDQVYAKIRNLKYRYIKEDSLFPEEVDQYDPFAIREALHNSIAHQDYSKGGRISVVEREDGYLTFANLGEFLPGSIENIIESDSAPEHYRNSFLVSAMVNLNMIDTIGSGIKRIFRLQSKKLFPLPDYDIDSGRVSATLTGKVVDIEFARTLVRNPDLRLSAIFLLDKVTKKRPLTDDEIGFLKGKGFIEGRKPNFHLSSAFASRIDQKAEYIRNRGFKDRYYKELILGLIEKYGSATKEDIDKLLLDLLPTVLSQDQKENKVRNLVYAMSKRDQLIENTGTNRKPVWVKFLPE